jgi:hypothetical protein
MGLACRPSRFNRVRVMEMTDLIIELKLFLATSNLILHPNAPLKLHNSTTGDELVYRAATNDERKERASSVTCIAGLNLSPRANFAVSFAKTTRRRKRYMT